MDRESVKESINIIQIKIDSLIACQQALRGILNGLAPISRLPREVLSHIIFNLVVHSPSKCTSGITSRPYLVLTQVCRSWRRLALDNSALWTSPDFTCPELAQMMLERAGKMPLSISFYDINLTLAQGFTDEFQRLKDLSITSTAATPMLSELLALVITTPQPPLESMNICVQTFTTLRDDILDYIRHPRFKHLILNNCGVPLSSTRLSGLSSLYVTIPGRHLPFTPVNFLGLVQLLRQNPGLVSLTLIGVLSAEERLANSPSLLEVVPLPKLQYLNIDGLMHESAHSCFFASVQAPKLSYIRLPVIVTDVNIHRSDYSQFALSVRTFLENMDPSMSIRNVTINPCAFFVRGSDDPHVSLAINISCARPEVAEIFKLRLFFEAGNDLWSGNAQDCAAAFLDNLPVKRLDALTIRISGRAAEYIEVSGLWTAASSLPELANFTIRHDKSSGIDPDLLEPLTTTADDSQSASFPALKKLVWESDWDSQFRVTQWKKAMSSFVEATQLRATLPQATPCEFILHQRWPATSEGRKEAKIHVYDSQVTGEFQRMWQLLFVLDYTTLF